MPTCLRRTKTCLGTSRTSRAWRCCSSTLSTLDTLLAYLGALVLTGLTGDICVLFTAHDAYMRDFNLVVPSDCIASEDPADNEYTLRKLAGLMDADTRPSAEIDFEELQRRAAREPEPNPEPEPNRTARAQTARG